MILYGRGPKSIAKATGISVDEAKQLIDTFYKTFPDMKPFIERKQEYSKRTGYIETFFGDKITAAEGREMTTGINFVIQNMASTTLAESFGNMCLNSLQQGRPLSPKCVVHDSITVSSLISNLLDAYDDITKFFYDYAYEKYGLIFKYDLDLMVRSQRDKVEFSYDHTTGDVHAKGYIKDIDYLREKFKQYYKFEEISCISKLKPISIYENTIKNEETPKIRKFFVDEDMIIPEKVEVHWKVFKK